MKKILGIILVLSAFLLAAPHANARIHRHYRRERVRVVYYRRPIVYRSYYSEPVYYYHPHRIHVHVPGVHANAGVGIGPIHVGAGIHLHEVMPPAAGPAADPSGINMELNEVPFFPSVDTISATMQQTAIADTVENNYSATWTPPRVVTVDGFTVPVTGQTMHYSLLKHQMNFIHNTKGEDPTAQFGVSPRGGGIPQTIGGSGLPATSFQ
ncbi:MAG TPA: hypothetical protein VGM92_13235 [Candidatus Kapabacteria bacterium]|jgi:hypothetical protein